MRSSSPVRNQLLGDYSETDLTKLQLQYRRAEAARRAYTDKTQGLILRDKREIQRLRDEYENLLQNLQLCQTSRSQWTDTSFVHDLTAMLAWGDKIDEELRTEKGKVASLKDQIMEWERKLAGQRTGGGTTHHYLKSHNSNLLKITCLIENKLHRGRTCFSELMSKNGQLREELKPLQAEKKYFLHLQSGLKKELHAIRKDIFDLMTKCTEAFDASVKIQEEHRMLTDQNAKDITQHIKERISMEQELSHFCNFEAFLDLKTIVPVTQDFDNRKVEKCKHPGSKEWKLEDFQDVIKKIFNETAESDLDKLVRNFIQKEGQNYTLLNFINYQHNEAETYRRQITKLHNKMEIFSSDDQKQQEHQVLQMRVSIKQEATEQQLLLYQQHVEGMEKLLVELKKGVNSLLHISHNSLVILNHLGSSDGVRDENVTEYLRMVEERVSVLLTLQSYLLFQEIQNQWDIESLSRIAGQLVGITQPPIILTTAASSPAPDYNQDSLESVLLGAEEPMSREDLLTLVIEESKEKEDMMFPFDAAL